MSERCSQGAAQPRLMGEAVKKNRGKVGVIGMGFTGRIISFPCSKPSVTPGRSGVGSQRARARSRLCFIVEVVGIGGGF
jgi:hypothetical protein